MSDSKTEYLHKGARVINAAINELDLSDELKETAQQVVTLFATNLLPGLWLRKPAGARPDAGSGPPTPETPADPTPEQMAQFRQQIIRLVQDDDDDEALAPMQADKSLPRQSPAMERKAKADIPPPRQDPVKEPAWDSDTIKMVHGALDILRRTHENQIRLVNEAFIAAAKRGADPMDMLEVLLHAATYCREDPTVPTLAELTSQATRRDVH